jgi:hypothetical protein
MFRPVNEINPLARRSTEDQTEEDADKRTSERPFRTRQARQSPARTKASDKPSCNPPKSPLSSW